MSDTSFAVSVIIPVYNAEKFLIQAVESALQQPEVGEVVLVDDGSTDSSYSVAQNLCVHYPDRISLYSHKERVNKGPGRTRNLGLNKARCAFIAFLDADDWYLPGYFAEAREAFANDPDLYMVRHPLGNAWDPNDPNQAWFLEYTGKDRAEARFHSRVENVSPDEYFENLYPLGDIGSGVAGTLTVRRSIALTIGGFPQRPWAEDATFHLKLAAIGRVDFADMETPLAMRRIHADNWTRGMAERLYERVDSIGQALLDLAGFCKKRATALSKRRAIHRGWIRFGHLYQSNNPLTMLLMDPISAMSPRIMFAYCKLTAFLCVRWIWRKFKAVYNLFE